MSGLPGKRQQLGRKLVAAARKHLKSAYAPYSGFPVAAAVLDERGRLFTAVNVENASFGLTICAERAAVFAAVGAGAKRIHAVAVTAKLAKSVEPCGACRQVMAEFCDPDAPVFSDAGGGEATVWTLADLLPTAFSKKRLRSGRSW